MFLSSPAELQAALAKIQPRRIAVAYLGAGWRDYLPLDSLDEIIVSPTLGTNPWALADLLEHAAAHGRPDVYFLETLHAKLYLGEAAALVGSANLTHNGLGGGLREAGMLVAQRFLAELKAAYLAPYQASAGGQ